MHAPERMDDGTHRRTAVPDAFEAMAARTDDDGSLLPTRGAVTHRGRIIAEYLQGIEEVIEVLNFSDGTETSHRQADSLAGNGAFTNARVRHAQLPKLLLHAFHGLVHPANLTRILAERNDFRVGIEQGFEIALKDLASIYPFLVVVCGRINGHLRNGIRPGAVQVFAVTFAVLCVQALREIAQRSERRSRCAAVPGKYSSNGTVQFRTTGKKTVAQGRNLRRTRFHSFDRSNDLFHLRIDWGSESRPCRFLFLTDLFFRLFSDGIQLLLGRRTFHHQKATKLNDAIVFRGPRHAFLGFVPLVRARCAMALGLGHLFHVHQDRNVVFSAPVCGSLIGGDKRGVIPTLHAENDQTIGALFHFHAAQRSRNRSFGRLILLRYADAVTIVPHIHEHGHFKHAGRVHGFPEQAFRCARIADGPDGNLIAATRKT